MRLDRVRSVLGVGNAVTCAECPHHFGQSRSRCGERGRETAHVERTGFVYKRLAYAGGKREAAGVDVAVDRHEPSGRLSLQPFAHVPLIEAGALGKLGGTEGCYVGEGLIQT